jgi:hypothetical protein
VYARALDIIAEAGVPIHITEINVFTPEDQQVRAAHLAGAMRLWWGHPGVAQFGFWSLWNGVSGKSDYDVGLYDDEKQITPMGQAVMHLLNDRWRTRTTTTVGADGALSLPAAAGEYLVQWTLRSCLRAQLGRNPDGHEARGPRGLGAQRNFLGRWSMTSSRRARRCGTN